MVPAEPTLATAKAACDRAVDICLVRFLGRGLLGSQAAQALYPAATMRRYCHPVHRGKAMNLLLAVLFSFILRFKDWLRGQ